MQAPLAAARSAASLAVGQRFSHRRSTAGASESETARDDAATMAVGSGEAAPTDMSRANGSDDALGEGDCDSDGVDEALGVLEPLCVGACEGEGA